MVALWRGHPALLLLLLLASSSCQLPAAQETHTEHQHVHPTHLAAKLEQEAGGAGSEGQQPLTAVKQVQVAGHTNLATGEQAGEQTPAVTPATTQEADTPAASGAASAAATPAGTVQPTAHTPHALATPASHTPAATAAPDHAQAGPSGQQAQQSAAAQACEYGMLPGRWVAGTVDRPAFMNESGTWKVVPVKHPQWVTYGPECELENLVEPTVQRVTELLGQGGGAAGKLPGHILFVGDSIDLFMLQDICALAQDKFGYDKTQMNIGYKHAGVTENPHPVFDCDHCSVCSVGDWKIAMLSIWGVFPSNGTYWMFKNGSATERIPSALEKFRLLTGGEPALVTVGTNFWDLAYLFVNHGELLEAEELEPWLLERWAELLGGVLRLLDASLPRSTLRVFHNQVQPALEDECSPSGKMAKGQVGRRSHVAALNSRGLAAASRAGWRAVDLERWALKFTRGEQYLRDSLHPRPFVCLELFNVYLNLMRQAGLL